MAVISSPVLILGSGPAGYSAAIYAARALRDPVLVAGIRPGGQLSITTEVENYPGFADPVQGPWLMEQMRAQAERLGVRICEDHIEQADLSGSAFALRGESEYLGSSLIVSTGAEAKWLGLSSELHFRGFGVSACATCDGFFYRDKPVLVVGGGNTALEEALYLSNFASKVTLVHRRGSFRGEKILQQRVLANSRIEIVWNSVLEEIYGDESPKSVTGVRLGDLLSGERRDLVVDGVFIAIGHAPQTSLFEGQLELDSGGYIVTSSGSTASSVRGVFAAGDVADPVYRQAVTAAGMGCMAALDAEKFLAALE